MTASQPIKSNNQQNVLGGMVAQQVAQRPLLMIGAAAVAGFVFGQIERSRSMSSSKIGMKAGSSFGFAARAMDAAASSGPRPMSLQDFANRYTSL